jgi:hypothetical protein
MNYVEELNATDDKVFLNLCINATGRKGDFWE